MRRQRIKENPFCSSSKLISFSFFLFLCLILPQLSFAATTVIEKLRIRPSSTETQLIFELSRKAAGKIKYLSDPDRVLIEFSNATKNFTMTNVKLGGSNIKLLNANSVGKNVQFELITKGRARWKAEYEDNKTLIIKIITEPQKTPAPVHDINQVKEEKLVGRERYKKIRASLQEQHPTEVVIVVDAGHGGKDPGAIGRSGLREKDVALNVALKLAKKINNVKGMRAVLTRKGDYYLSLRQRLQIARKHDADLFMSIHADAYVNKKAKGASIYALSTRGATSEAARWLANRENYSELGDIKFSELDNANKVLRSVLIDMSQTVTIRDSLRLGNHVLDALDDVSDLHRKKVEQAPFVVLKSPDIPSVLVETGFITNPYEERRLQQSYYQEKLASALFHGVRKYFSSHYYQKTASLKRINFVA